MSIDGSANGNFTWWNTTATTTNSNLTFNDSFTLTTANGTSWHPVIPDKDWMPYRYFEYEPIWHQKFARYKIQISKMWD